MDSIFSQYIESDKFDQKADNTQSIYQSVYKNHIAQKFGNKFVQSYSRGGVELFLETKTPGIQRSLAVFFNLEKWLLRHDLITAHRLTGLKTQPMGKRRRSISDDTIAELLSVLDHNNLVHSAIHFQILIGLRIGEVLTLKWDYVNFKDKTVTIQWKNIKTERKAAVVHRDHVLPIPSQKAQALLLMKQHGTTGYVFKSAYKGKKIVVKTVNAILRPYDCTSHILRKTVGTAIFSTLELGATELQLILNHSLVKGSDQEYIDSEEQFLPRKLKTLNAWHTHLDRLMRQVEAIK